MDSASSQQRRFDLPIGALSHVSSYLAPPSRALFAVALNCYDVERSSAIVSDQQDVLDFGDIERQLAVKLTDDDVRNILLSIDAVNNLRTLRLTNLLNITGMGLEPLRGSTMIEKIDLSLVGDHESPELSPAPPISCTEVLPILDSIIDMGEACPLKLLIFPKEWRKERNTESEFHAFLIRYKDLLCSRVVSCLECDNNIEGGTMLQIWNGANGRYYQYGTQDVTCYDCMKHYCVNCEVDGDEGEIYCMSDVCRICNRCYCLHCSREWSCNSCDGWFCVDCMPTKQCAACDENTCLNCITERGCRNNCTEEEKLWCDHCVRCGDAFKLCGCNGCVNHGNAFQPCENCDVDYCVDCCDNSDTVYSVDCCNVCDEVLCGKCRVIKCKERTGDGCTGCYRLAFPALLEDKERLRQEMQAEIDEQEKEISELKEENGELKRKLKDLNGEVGE